jgi:hypothetical protein
MPAVKLAPIFNESAYQNQQGEPNSGGFIYTYFAGSDSALATTYTTGDGSVANANPIPLDASGRPNTNIWLVDNMAYHITLTDSNGTVLAEADNITGTTGSAALPPSGSFDATYFLSANNGDPEWIQPLPLISLETQGMTLQNNGYYAYWNTVNSGPAPTFMSQFSAAGSCYMNGSYFDTWNQSLYQPTTFCTPSGSKILFNNSGYFMVNIQAAAISTTFPGYYWPANLTQFGTILPGYYAVMKNNSRHSTWTGSTPQDFRGLAQNLGSTPNPEEAAWNDSYPVFVGAGQTLDIAVYVANYTYSTTPYNPRMMVTIVPIQIFS